MATETKKGVVVAFQALHCFPIFNYIPGNKRRQKACDCGVENWQEILATSWNIDRQLLSQQFNFFDLLTILPD